MLLDLSRVLLFIFIQKIVCAFRNPYLCMFEDRDLSSVSHVLPVFSFCTDFLEFSFLVSIRQDAAAVYRLSCGVLC